MRPRLAAATATAALLAAACTFRSNPGRRYVIPDHFHACIAIGLEVRGAKPLPRQGGFQLVEVTRAGQVFETSDGPIQGQRVDEVWRRTPSGLRRTQDEDEPSGGWGSQKEGGTLYDVVCFGGGQDVTDLEFPFKR